MTPHDAIIDQERAHENAWYARALEERFFEREAFRRGPLPWLVRSQSALFWRADER